MEGYARRSRQCRVRMNIRDALGGFAWQSRWIEVIDVRDVGVEQVEYLQHDARAVGDAVSRFGIPQRRALRLDARTLDERSRTKVAHAKTAKQRPLRLKSWPQTNNSERQRP